jgi:hypothetical protein
MVKRLDTLVATRIVGTRELRELGGALGAPELGGARLSADRTDPCPKPGKIECPNTFEIGEYIPELMDEWRCKNTRLQKLRQSTMLVTGMPGHAEGPEVEGRVRIGKPGRQHTAP